MTQESSGSVQRVYRVDITRVSVSRHHTVYGQHFLLSHKAVKNARMLADLLPEAVSVSVVECEKGPDGIWRDVYVSPDEIFIGTQKDFRGAPPLASRRKAAEAAVKALIESGAPYLTPDELRAAAKERGIDLPEMTP